VEEWGADMVNDVTEGTGTDDGGETMFGCVGKMKVPYILTSVEPDVKTIVKRFRKELAELQALGAEDVILDPGFGFGKTLEENYRLLADMEKLKTLKRPILVGVSRKSMIYKALGITPDEALNGTTVLNTMALMKGANILRVHDVQEAVEAVNIFKLLTIKD